MQLLPDMTNTQAVERIKAGDGEVFDQLYQACYRMVYFQANKILGNEDEAQSVVQDVFIAVYRSINRLLDPEALRSWIGGITVRLALKRRQRLRSSREFALEDEAMVDILDAGGGKASPEEDLCRQDTGRILGELVDELPQEQRETVMLFYYDQCAVKEIAQIMSCAEGTVKSRLNYARRQLEKRILQREQREGIRLHAINPGLLFLAFTLQEQRVLLDPEIMRQGLNAVKAILGLAAGGAAAGSAAAGAAGDAAGAGAGSALSAGGTGSAAGGGTALGGTVGAAGSAAASAAAGGLGGKITALVMAGVLLAGTGGAMITQLPPIEVTPTPSPTPGLTAVYSPVTPVLSPSAAPEASPSPTASPEASTQISPAVSTTASPGASTPATPSPQPSVTAAPRPSAAPTPTPRATPTPTSRPTPTPASADGSYFTNYYREDYGNGEYLQVQLNGTTLTASGMRVLDSSLYNYVVISTTGSRAEIPFVSGQPFSASVQVDLDILQQIEDERPGSPYAYSVVTVQICQNYTPGDSSFAGASFQEASLGTVRSGSGCTIKVMPR